MFDTRTLEDLVIEYLGRVYYTTNLEGDKVPAWRQVVLKYGNDKMVVRFLGDDAAAAYKAGDCIQADFCIKVVRWYGELVNIIEASNVEICQPIFEELEEDFKLKKGGMK